MLQKFVLNLLVQAVQNEKIRAFLLEAVERLAALLLPKLASVIPVAVGAGIKGLGDLIDGIDLPDVEHVVEDIRTEVNKQLPNGIDIPFLSEAFRNATGFDLSDTILGRHE